MKESSLKNPEWWLDHLLDYRRYLQDKPSKYDWTGGCLFCNFVAVYCFPTPLVCPSCIWKRPFACEEWRKSIVEQLQIEDVNNGWGIGKERMEKPTWFVKARLAKLKVQIAYVRRQIRRKEAK